MDSNRSRARAKARRHAEQARALRAVARARRRLGEAQAQLDAALVAAVSQHARSSELRETLGGVTHATFWRRVKAAREAVA
jgi:hypothetical protein